MPEKGKLFARGLQTESAARVSSRDLPVNADVRVIGQDTQHLQFHVRHRRDQFAMESDELIRPHDLLAAFQVALGIGREQRR